MSISTFRLAKSPEHVALTEERVGTVGEPSRSIPHCQLREKYDQWKRFRRMGKYERKLPIVMSVFVDEPRRAKHLQRGQSSHRP